MNTKPALIPALAALFVFTAALPAAPMDDTTLADFDFSDAQKTRTQTLIDNGTIQLERVLTAPDTGYRHMGWPVATRLPDGRTVVLIRNTRNHSGYETWPDNARRVIYSDDMAAWLPADVLEAPPVLGVNTEGDIDTYGKYDFSGMHAISWAYPTGTAAASPRLVAVTGKDDRDSSWPSAKTFRVYLSDDRGVTWREQLGALSAMPSGAVNSGPNMIRHPDFGLVVPFGQQTGTGVNKQNYLAASANAGESWQIRTWLNAADSRSIEPALATWGPGHMVMIGRERTNAYGYDAASGKYYYTQHVYKHTPGAAFSAVTFNTARTNIAGNGKTPVAKSKNAYEAHDTADVIYNPVTGRIEMIQSSRWGNGAEDPLPADPTDVDTVNNSLNLWSIDPVDLLNGGTTWRFDGNLVERQGIILGGAAGTYGSKGNKDGYHPGGSIVDEAAGKQHIFIYVGIYTAYANAYRVSRPLDTYAFREACGLPALPKPSVTAMINVDANNIVTITGTNFASLKEVLIVDKTASIVSSTDTEIKITIPAGVTKGDKITIRTDNGVTSGTADFTHTAPVLTGVSYQSIWPGNKVTFTGTNLSVVNKVLFGTTEVTTFISKTDTEIVVLVPEGITDGLLAVQGPGGTAYPPGAAGGAYTIATKPGALGALVDTQPAVTGLHPVDLIASATGNPAPGFKWQYRYASDSEWLDLPASADYEGVSSGHLTILNTAGKNKWQFRYAAINYTEDAYSNELTLQLLAESIPAPAGLAAASGTDAPDLYVADAQSHTIQKITQSDWQAAALAGQSGAPGNADGTATAAQFRSPRGVAITAAGELVVADTGNSLLRSITAAGVVTTTATAFNQPRAVTAHDTSGNTYIADTANHLIKKLSPEGELTIIAGAGVSGFANGLGPSAQFNTPSGIAVDIAGNLYIADTGNNAIRYISAATGSVSTFAGRPAVAAGSTDGAISAATFKAPQGVAVDASGDVFVGDTGNSLIREIHSGTIRTIAGQRPGIAGFKDGTGTNAWFDRPAAIAIAEDGNLYVADTGNAVIRRIASDGEVTTLPLMPITAPGTPPPAGGQGGGGSGGGGAPAWCYFAALAMLLITRALSRKK